MKRSTYSLILMDDVVAAIDRLAAQQGTSRSNLINQILAEHVSCVTPEQQMRQIFACLTQQMNSHPGARLRCDAFNSWFCAVQVPSDHPLQRGTAS